MILADHLRISLAQIHAAGIELQAQQFQRASLILRHYAAIVMEPVQGRGGDRCFPEQFVKDLLNGLMPPPAYFPLNVLLNIKGYENFKDVLKRSKEPLSPDAFEAAANETGALILDTRDAEVFA